MSVLSRIARGVLSACAGGALAVAAGAATLAAPNGANEAKVSAPTSGAQPALTLEQIMADPDWIGPPATNAYWSTDGRSAYYSMKRTGSPVVDLHRVEIAKGADRVVDAPAMAEADGPPIYDRAGAHAAFIRNGDVFVRALGNGRLTQVTRSPQHKSNPQFSADGRSLSFRIESDWFVYDLQSGVMAPAVILKLEKDPDAPPKADDLRDMQLRTFSTLKKLHDDKETLRHNAVDMQKNDPSRAALPFYLGEDIAVIDTSLSPDARWLLVVTEPKTAEVGFEGKLTRYVTESGHEEFDKERVRVGRNPPTAQSLLLLNLVDHSSHTLALDSLPGIHDDLLKSIREENGTTARVEDLYKGPPENQGAKAVAGGEASHAAAGNADAGAATASHAAAGQPGTAPPPAAAAGPLLRAVTVKSKDPDDTTGGVSWSNDGHGVAIQLRALDNKDRWLATVDFSTYTLVPQHRLTDMAWINWTFNEFGWLNDNKTLWYESEESGYAHLYTKPVNGAAHALTQGRFEVYDPELSADGRWFYVRSNAQAPYAFDVYRVSSGGGALQRVTWLEGVEAFSLQHRGDELLLTHSSSYIREQVAVAKADGSGAARDLTDTRTPEYRAMTWIKPEIVEVPSTHFNGTIFAKVYRAPASGTAAPASNTGGKSATSRPGVIFVHGAGYTQNVHLRFPYYFREQMFHNLLVQQGYAVIDMDYRASSGYGRDWRTAIYRQMGHPELEDLLDGKQWLVEHAGVDPKRVGIYGGSYGGFMTLMALFRAPGEFAAGAALRPVTDWMQYDDNYTADILNDPQIDPMAYRRSSPIEFAAGLQDALLICHGVVDDNVLFEDSMRLYERLIELHKDNFTLAPFPLDSHGFTNADSWLDEYKRVRHLFDSTLMPGH